MAARQNPPTPVWQGVALACPETLYIYTAQAPAHTKHKMDPKSYIYIYIYTAQAPAHTLGNISKNQMEIPGPRIHKMKMGQRTPRRIPGAHHFEPVWGLGLPVAVWGPVQHSKKIRRTPSGAHPLTATFLGVVSARSHIYIYIYIYTCIYIYIYI